MSNMLLKADYGMRANRRKTLPALAGAHKHTVTYR